LTAEDGRDWKYCGSGLPLAPVNSWHSRLEPTGHGQHVALDQAVHAGDADRRQQRADRRRDQRH
jgi:hypothetical protein